MRRPSACHRLAALSLSLACLARFSPPARAAGPEPGTAAWFDLHAFEGNGGCLVVRESQHLRPGDSVLVLALGRRAATRHVATISDADSAKRIFEALGFQGVYQDSGLWNRIGCWWFVKDADAPRMVGLARLESWEGEAGPIGFEQEAARHGMDLDLPLALDRLPPSALSVGGERTALAGPELAAAEKRWQARLPQAFARGKRLRAGWRYRGDLGGEFLEVFIGKPFETPSDPGPPIDSVAYCRLILHAGRLLAVDTLFRASGVEEHVDLEPPQLDEDNWYRTSEETMGFLSLDGGVSWARVSVDVGFEGIAWLISPLRQGSRTWSRYLYTRH